MISIGLINPKDVDNVGSVLRAIGCYKADRLFYSGKRYRRALNYRTDTNNIRDKSYVAQVDDILDARRALPAGTKVVCIELVVGAVALPDYQHPQSALYIFGPEDGSIPQSVVDAADDVVYIPTVGCMNLAATVNVVLYDRMAKLGLAAESADDRLIMASRDNRNNLKVK